jgi:lipopolysaccharide transport system ATP-binding protein
MTTPAIAVEGVGKKYIIAHQQRERYVALRDVITRGAKSMATALFRRGHRRQKSREEFWALQDVSFEVPRGQSVGIIGRNGAGKSTLLKILSRITEPTTGRAVIRGRLSSLLEVGTGFHPELTGRENVFLNGAILGMGKAEIERKFDDIIAFAGVEKFLDTPVKHYSSGMHVRLAFSVSAHLEPDILVVDEVLSVGDLDFQKRCFGKMESAARDGRTVICVSHDLSAIHRLCTRAILLQHGKVLVDADTDSVIRTYVSQGRQDRPVFFQKHEPSKAMNLRKVSLLANSGEPAAEFRYDEGFAIEIEYEVNEPTQDSAVWFGLRTMEELVAFGSADTDVDASLLQRRGAGYYRTRLDIPAKWLNAGRYYLVVGITKYSPLMNFDRAETSTFTVLDVGTPEKLRTGGSRPGVLQPYMAWKTDRVQDAGETVR